MKKLLLLLALLIPSTVFADTCLVTTAAPDYTNQLNQQANISCDANGNIRTGGSVTVSGGGAAAYITTPNAKLAGIYGMVTGYGSQQVSVEPSTLFNDPFDGGVIDTTSRWTTQVLGGTITAGSGVLTIAPTTVSGNYAAIYSKPTFGPPGASFLLVGESVKIEAAPVAGTLRFWGQGTVPTTPTVASPITEGIGFQIDAAGVFRGVVYSGGAIIGQTAPLTLPSDGGWHGYGYDYRSNVVLFLDDTNGYELPVGSILFVTPATQTLPIVALEVNNTTLGSTPTFQVGAVIAGDSASNNNTISDANNQWQRLAISATGAAQTQDQDQFVTGAATQTASGNNILLATAGSGWFDASGYRSIAMEIAPTGTVSSGVVTFEQTNDITSGLSSQWPVYDENNSLASPITTISPATGVGRFLIAPVHFRYVRARISTVIGGGGSIQALTRLSPNTFQASQTAIIQSSGSNLQANVVGNVAHSTASSNNPVRVGGRVNTAVDTTLIAGDVSDDFMTTSGAKVIKPYAVPEVDWQATSNTTALATTTSTPVKSAGAAGVRNYVTACQITNTSATVSTTVTILDGATVLYTDYLPATTAALPVESVHVEFPTPLRGTAATAVNIQLGTTSANVYWNCQGYQAI